MEKKLDSNWNGKKSKKSEKSNVKFLKMDKSNVNSEKSDLSEKSENIVNIKGIYKFKLFKEVWKYAAIENSVEDLYMCCGKNMEEIKAILLNKWNDNDVKNMIKNRGYIDTYLSKIIKMDLSKSKVDSRDYDMYSYKTFKCIVEEFRKNINNKKEKVDILEFLEA